jgi:hypothetical protein
MTETKPIIRTEDDGDTLRVVTPRQEDLVGGVVVTRQNVLTREYEDFFTLRGPTTDDVQYLRIGTAAQKGDNDGWKIHGANGIYAEVPLKERSVTEAERKWCSNSDIHQGTESVVEFTIPHPEALQTAILDQDIDGFDCLDAVIKDHESRHKILTNLQERIVKWMMRENQLDPDRGLEFDVEGLWNPSTNDDCTKEQLHQMANEVRSGHAFDWYDTTGYSYLSFHNARFRLLDTGEFNPYPADLCPLDIAGYPEWTYCQVCGAVGPPSEFSPKEVEWADKTVRSCEQCFETEWPDV